MTNFVTAAAESTVGYPFTWKCRVVGVSAAPGPAVPRPLPGIPVTTTWSYGSSKIKIKSNKTGWSNEGTFTLADAKKAESSYPGSYLPSWWKKNVALITHMNAFTEPAHAGVNTSLTDVQCQIKTAAGESCTVTARLFGQNLGLMVSVNSATSGMKQPVMSMGAFNDARYGAAFAKVKVKKRPTKFPVVDRCICSDDDWLNWFSCVKALNSLGLHGIEADPPNPFVRRILALNGQDLTSMGIYAPPGAEPDTGITSNSTYMQAWASKQLKSFFAAGFNSSQLTTFALADEPGWYFPRESPEMLMNVSTARGRALQAEWIRFLSDHHITASDFGQHGTPVPSTKRWQLRGLAEKKLFYWSSRFSSFSSAQAFARATVALEHAIGRRGFPVYVNFNNFAGRGYVPGPVGNNRDKTDPNSAMVALDWFEFGRARGSTLMWTEDWFGDSEASQWGYYSARLRAAARLAPHKDVIYGGYIVPRAGGQLANGLLMKMMAIVGSGGKALKFYVFGPEYNFPGNCYSEDLVSNPALLESMAKGTSMIGAAEDLLWPAERVQSQIGILYPRSSFYWDETGVELPRGIMDCTNTHMLSGPHYQAEVFALYTALAERLNVPVDFLDEEELTPAALARFKAIFVTQPNLPKAGGAALAAWVKAGGTLITVPGAGGMDEYDEASTFQSTIGVFESALPRSIKTPTWTHNGTLTTDLPGCIPPGSGKPPGCAFKVYGGTTVPTSHAHPPTPRTVLATFTASGTPAITSGAMGRGLSYHFHFFPGMSTVYTYHSHSSAETLFTVLRNITALSRAHVPVSASHSSVETPLLEGPTGSVVTLLNWANQQFNRSTSLLTLNMTLGFTPVRAESVLWGKLEPKALSGGRVSVTLPLDAADFLLFYKK